MVRDISETLLQQLAPQLLRPTPAVTIMQFSSRTGQLHHPFVVPANLQMFTAPVGPEKIICRFKTTVATNVVPIKISAFNASPAPGGGTRFEITLVTDDELDFKQLNLADLQLYLHGNAAAILLLYFCLYRRRTGSNSTLSWHRRHERTTSRRPG